ncbi:hypothetical protein M441DRAFT_292652 [Trichoderma asperellum CBS 433.97]|uniref:Uncharacterized protein n=1 Tax=Trichoderma asperellum (strain ATCC 204424 / CBS 433.97 / NBRC 101777) TaxID=1042311 RepID=A0A2T3YT45_TRIA4|nr:hypothetical protein M441DRAFT_292652 [Trichoderma asperellum CBS 433.97]PTB35707.1 hypothetical protein M441DRAFT_292652 [Trichoderma asperellum CBS 433.97]
MLRTPRLTHTLAFTLTSAIEYKQVLNIALSSCCPPAWGRTGAQMLWKHRWNNRQTPLSWHRTVHPLTVFVSQSLRLQPRRLPAHDTTRMASPMKKRPPIQGPKKALRAASASPAVKLAIESKVAPRAYGRLRQVCGCNGRMGWTWPHLHGGIVSWSASGACQDRAIRSGDAEQSR